MFTTVIALCTGDTVTQMCEVLKHIMDRPLQNESLQELQLKVVNWCPWNDLRRSVNTTHCPTNGYFKWRKEKNADCILASPLSVLFRDELG